MMRGSEIRPRSAGLSLRRHSTNWQPKDYVTIAFTSRHFVPRRARRCCRDGIIMLWDSGRFVNWLAVGRVTSTNWPTSAASIAKTFQLNGYNTAAIGKWHLTPDAQQGPAGPFDRWPNAIGFDYFWGFLEAKRANSIRFWRRTTRSSACRRRRIFISMTRWLSTRFPGFVIRKRRRRTNRSFSIFQRGRHTRHIRCQRNGATRCKGKFDQGWEKLREETFARQKQLGVIPANAKLTPRDPAFPAWVGSRRTSRRCMRTKWRFMPVTRKTRTTLSAAS